MIIKPNRHYIVFCEGKDKKVYIWNLIVLPGYKSWNILNENIRVNQRFRDHLILSIEDVTESLYPNIQDFYALSAKKRNAETSAKTPKRKRRIITEADLTEDEIMEYYSRNSSISKEDFDFAVHQSDIGFAVKPSYSQAYRCDICGGIVANDRCTECMFDWDS